MYVNVCAREHFEHYTLRYMEGSHVSNAIESVSSRLRHLSKIRQGNKFRTYIYDLYVEKRNAGTEVRWAWPQTSLDLKSL